MFLVRRILTCHSEACRRILINNLKKIFPPNCWNCRCIVTQLTKGDVRRKGLTVESSENHLREVTEIVGGEEKPNTVYTFSKNGNIYELKPDAGWNNNAGKATIMDDVLMGKIEKMPKEVKKHFINEIAEKQKTEPRMVQNLYRKTIPVQKALEIGLEKEDLIIIQRYTHNSTPFNKTILKELNGENITEKDKVRIQALTNVFDKATPTKEIFVTYRGEGAGILKQLPNFEKIENIMLNPKNENDIKFVINELTTNTVKQDLFMSTSFELQKAKEYAMNANEPRLLWTITTKKGARAIDTRNLSSKKYEEELLFDKGYKYQIKKVKYDKKEKLWKLSATIL